MMGRYPRGGSSRRRTGLASAALLLTACVGALGVAPASAAAPWWHVTSFSRPSDLHVGAAHKDVQKLTVSGGAGESYILAKMTNVEVAQAEFKEGNFAVLPVTASASEVQQGLETIYGAGNVEVSGGPGDEKGTTPYTLTFTGALAYQSVVPLNTTAGAIYLGFAGTVELTQVTEGKPDGEIIVSAANLGNAPTSAPTTIRDRLPAGLEAISMQAVAGESTSSSLAPVQCSLGSLSCEYSGALPPYEQIEVKIGVIAKSAVSGAPNEADVTGGGAPAASIARPVATSEAPTPFGPEFYEPRLEDEHGAPASQAGSHPFQFTTTLLLDELAGAHVPALGKDLSFALPPGLIGNPTPLAQCTAKQFLTRIEGVDNECPPSTVVGIVRITVNEPTALHLATLTLPLFNLEPRPGEPARFGFLVLFTPVYIDTSVRTGGDYGITATVSNISQSVDFLKSEVTFWGVPGSPSHDEQRDWGCLEAARGVARPTLPCAPLGEHNPPPFLELPTSCTGPLQGSIRADSWREPENMVSLPAEPMWALDGCNQLPFAPSIQVTPDVQAASTPTGLTVDVHVPQDASVNTNGLADAEVKDISVTLPEGVKLNPAAADGLQACSEAEIGYLAAASAPPGELHFSSGLPAPKGMPQEPFCPDASKIATVDIRTPLLPNTLKGAVYLATPAAGGEPGMNPFDALVAMYLVAEDPVSGSLVKLPGSLSIDQNTGRITATFHDTPQLPFEDAELHFFGGDRAPLVTPSLCGTYTTEASLTPWSTEPGEAPRTAASQFQILTAPAGSSCPSALPFSPTLVAGTTNINAGSFTPLTTTISREDGNQDIQSVQLHMPPGLAGILAGVELCPEAQANAGTCGPESLIGHTLVSVGLGGDPFTVTGGQVFLTEKYDGAPFGLSIVNPAKAGPFDLGRVVVRAKVEIDPKTAELTVTTNSSGPYAIPHILDGIPLQIKHVNVTIDRPGFTFNPTNCDPTAVTGAVGSDEGATAPVAVPFQVTNCASLAFKPQFKVTTSAKTSRLNGASLHVSLVYPKAPFGTQANVREVKVELPRQLPSRLSTLQRACLAAQFDANPARCPAASIVGHAKAITPLLPVPLEGPAYFVSNGSEAWPNLVVVLQGYGVTIDLVGNTFISKQGVTSSTFKTVPDAPVGSFELTLPMGPYSALTAIGNLCKAKGLTMPTELLAQNGARIGQATRIVVHGCSKSRHRARKTTRRKRRKGDRRKRRARFRVIG